MDDTSEVAELKAKLAAAMAEVKSSRKAWADMTKEVASMEARYQDEITALRATSSNHGAVEQCARECDAIAAAQERNRDAMKGRRADEFNGGMMAASQCAAAIRLLATSSKDGAVEWRPIATAPKDGSTVLLLCPTRSGKWNKTLPLSGYWEEREHDGGFFVIFNAEEAIQRVEPTHWIPLTAIAAAGAVEGGKA